MIRGDLSNRLIHLTRGIGPEDAADNFKAIYSKKALLGSNEDIKCGQKVICFSEAPISALTQSLAADGKNGIRYAPFGAMVSKKWLFEQGGRPVIYQPDYEFEELSESKKHLHVPYTPSVFPDYSWEREWRIKTNCLTLIPEETTFIVPTRSWEKVFLDDHIQTNSLVSSMIDFPITDSMEWHFIALEDLGVEGFESFQAPNDLK